MHDYYNQFDFATLFEGILLFHVIYLDDTILLILPHYLKAFDWML